MAQESDGARPLDGSPWSAPGDGLRLNSVPMVERLVRQHSAYANPVPTAWEKRRERERFPNLLHAHGLRGNQQLADAWSGAFPWYRAWCFGPLDGTFGQPGVTVCTPAQPEFRCRRICGGSSPALVVAGEGGTCARWELTVYLSMIGTSLKVNVTGTTSTSAGSRTTSEVVAGSNALSGRRSRISSRSAP